MINGNEVEVQGNNGETLLLTDNGIYNFTTEVNNDFMYEVSVMTQPTSPDQTCTIDNEQGTVDLADVSNININCVIDTFEIGGNLSGLIDGNEVIIQNNEGDDLTLTEDGMFRFTIEIADEEMFDVSVLTEPSSPDQTCTVTNGQGNIDSADFLNVFINCEIDTDTFEIGGNLLGLIEGNEVVIQNNAADNLTLTEDGMFRFLIEVADEEMFDVSVLTQPTSPDQTCTVTNGQGNIDSADFLNVSINCEIDTFEVGGNLVGLIDGNEVVIQNNAGDNLTLMEDGLFRFPIEIADEEMFNVSVLTQPTIPDQTCTVTNGQGNIDSANALDVSINCGVNTFTIGGSLTGLLDGNELVLQNKGTDNLTLNTNGDYEFSTEVADKDTYLITVLSQPTRPNQTCLLSNAEGTVNSDSVTNINISCDNLDLIFRNSFD
ncbi:MAG: hypothetical protein AB8B80_15535 [Marinicellaceae bacterium]